MDFTMRICLTLQFWLVTVHTCKYSLLISLLYMEN